MRIQCLNKIVLIIGASFRERFRVNAKTEFEVTSGNKLQCKSRDIAIAARILWCIQADDMQREILYFNHNPVDIPEANIRIISSGIFNIIFVNHDKNNF